MKKSILSNIFSRSRPNTTGTLQTDAVPVDDPPGNENTNSISENINNNASLNSGDFNAAMQLQAQIAESEELSVMRSTSNTEVIESPTGNTTSVTNNQMAVHNTQGQVVMQFSNINGLHFGSVFNFNNEKLEQPVTDCAPGNATRSAARNNRPRRTTTIEAMMRSSDELNHKMLDTISTHLGEGWKNVIRSLDFTQGEIDQAMIDNQIHGGVKEVIYQLLLSWTRNADDGKATLGIITQILWKSGHRECVQKMKETWKQDNAAKNS